MKKITVIGFPDKYIQELTAYVEEVSKSKEISKMYTYFQFFHNYEKGNADIVFLDSFSKIPEMIETGKQIRELDPKVIIVGIINTKNDKVKEEFISEIPNSQLIFKSNDNKEFIKNLIIPGSGEIKQEKNYIKQTGKTVMVVDDFENTLNVIKFTLEQSGFKVITASSGQDALKLFKQKIKPNIIITDLNMPNMNGFELIENIRKNSDLDGIPVFILTTEFNFNKKLKAKELNVTGWIQKPYNSQDFIRIITNVLE